MNMRHVSRVGGCEKERVLIIEERWHHLIRLVISGSNSSHRSSSSNSNRVVIEGSNRDRFVSRRPSTSSVGYLLFVKS